VELSHTFLVNDLAPAVSLDGEWEFRLGDGPWRTVPVPSAWEAQVADKLTDGPAHYRRRFHLPESGPLASVVLEAGAISFDAAVRVNRHAVGRHQGMWSAFQFDITPYVVVGDNLLEIEVWKPGGRFPVRESLAGFLPDVAAPFGGLWQGLRVRAIALAAVADLKLLAYGAGWLDVQGRAMRLGERRRLEAQVQVFGPDGSTVARAHVPVVEDQTFSAHLEPRAVRPWQAGPEPALYTVQVSLISREVEIARVMRRIGFRTFSASDETVLQNGIPAHLRGVLDWGWDPERIAPSPPREQVLARFAQARALGFNMLKLCLYVPDEATFEAADEAGMLLWLEMPLWLPRLTPEARALVLSEYGQLFRRLHHHPSIAIVSLGCELNSEADAGFLHDLNRLARAWFPNSLHCDNSGSAEAYGGVSTGLSDFYDYHYYAEPHFFQPLIAHFDRTYQPRKPWIFGEFCDADTLRDFQSLDPAAWWLTADLALRSPDFLAAREWRERLERAGVADGGAALTGVARRQATAARKCVLELVRGRFPAGGYVVTGWTDTPITTSGVVDDQGQLKFNPDEWQEFNHDRVILMDRERRRRWTHGGDRPAQRDPFTWRQGETAEIHLLLSNGGSALEDARLQWSLRTADGEVVSQGEAAASPAGAAVSELAGLRLPLPAAPLPIELRLSAELAEAGAGQWASRNSWRLWAVPRAALPAPGVDARDP
jgi:hypothetical protein